MGAVSPARKPSGAYARDPLRPSILAIALTSVSAFLMLAFVNHVLSTAASSGEGSGRTHVRLLLQGTLSIADAAHGPQAVGSALSAADLQKMQQIQQPQQQQQLGSKGAAWGDLRQQQEQQQQASEDEWEEPAAKLTQPQLLTDDDVDLATFAAPGTHCMVTPSHDKVALLFLTYGDLPHAELWTAWMREARGLLPRGSLAGDNAFCLKQCNDSTGLCEQRCGREAACNPLCVDAIRRRLGADRSPNVLQQQHLYTVYVHARPTLKDYPEGSIFNGRLIADRVVAKWGAHSLAVAAKKLVEAAVLDRRNAWFVLVGDTTVPLYHPAVMWQQLSHESKSRLDACYHEDEYLMKRRCSPNMKSDRFNPDKHWRKSSQWFMLNRKHAELFVHDLEVGSLFGKFCNVGWDEELHKHRDCISDEHYLPSLLALYGLDDETTCDMTGGTYVQWEQLDETEVGHPMLFQPGHVTPELVTTMRQSVSIPPEVDRKRFKETCGDWVAASQAARAGFINAGAMTQDRCPRTIGHAEYLKNDPYKGAMLNTRCPLLARKFSTAAARPLHKLYRSCSAGLGVLTCSPSITDADNHWWQ